MIGVEDLVHVYPGGTRAVDGVDLEIAAGRAVAIVGQNGTGKSTLVRHFNGLLRPTEGRVLIDGVDAATLRVAELAPKVGLAFQDPDRQIFAGQVRAEVAFGPQQPRPAGSGLDAAVDAALAAVGLGDAAAQPVRPGLLAAQAAGARLVLAMDTPVLVLDEPTTGQDAAAWPASRRSWPSRGGRTHGRRDQPRHALRRRDFGRVIVMRAGGPPRRPAGRGLRRPGRRSPRRIVEPPLAARAGARLGLGSTPTEATLPAGSAALSRIPLIVPLATTRSRNDVSTTSIPAMTRATISGRASPSAQPAPAASRREGKEDQSDAADQARDIVTTAASRARPRDRVMTAIAVDAPTRPPDDRRRMTIASSASALAPTSVAATTATAPRTRATMAANRGVMTAG